MGRRRKGWADERKPITVSLPRQLIIDIDSTLADEHTRSRLFERLARNYLNVNTKLSNFNRHAYECHDCGRMWHQNRYSDPQFFFCAGKDGCGSSKIEYLGIWEEEE